jgi:hypothetical protein
MTKDDIIRMAREAGLQPYYDEQETDIEAFANLVAAAEREECAKVCEDASTPVAGEMLTDGQWASKILAGKIRARGNL